ncbi:hypothetical protein J6590_043329 [Homalodisca vitripennis]|nr:hypothetical protein J6590_043329 [Homalodisca vitripennis]
MSRYTRGYTITGVTEGGVRTAVKTVCYCNEEALTYPQGRSRSPRLHDVPQTPSNESRGSRLSVPVGCNETLSAIRLSYLVRLAAHRNAGMRQGRSEWARTKARFDAVRLIWHRRNKHINGTPLPVPRSPPVVSCCVRI